MPFKVPGKSSVDAGPRERPFDDPSFWQHDDAFGRIGSFDDFNGPWAGALGDQSPFAQSSYAKASEDLRASGDTPTPNRLRAPSASVATLGGVSHPKPKA